MGVSSGGFSSGLLFIGLGFKSGNDHRIDDIVDRTGPLEDVGGLLYTHQERSEDLSAGELLHEFIADVTGIESRENQNIRSAFNIAEREIRSTMSGLTAVSACISPSTMSSG